MEEILNSIFSIYTIKNKIEKKICKKFKCKIEDNLIFTEDGKEELLKNEEFNKLIKKYKFLKCLIDAIINFREKLEED